MINKVLCKAEGAESVILQLSDDIDKKVAEFYPDLDNPFEAEGELFKVQASILYNVLLNALPRGTLDSLAELMKGDLK